MGRKCEIIGRNITIMDYQDVVNLHVEVFGVEPVITGALYWESDTLIERILEEIDRGEAYVEPDVPDDMEV